jgi:hypothetical protein
MRRTEIPDALLKARRADIDRIPSTALAKMTRVDLVNRLVAAGEYRRRAAQQHQAVDAARIYADLAGETLTATDPKRVESLVKSAGVGVTIGAGRPATPARPTVRPAQAPPLMAAVRKSLGLPPRPSAASRSYTASEAAWQRSAAGRALAKAAEYRQRAAVVSDPQLRESYLELAAQERQKAGI